MNGKNLITQGIQFVVRGAQTSVQQMNQIGRSFDNVRQQAQSTAKEAPKSMKQTFPAFSRMWNQDLTKEWGSFQEQWDREFNNFQRNVRNQVNRFNSIIMGGVALSMTGYGMKNFGNRILGNIKSWIDTSMEFNKTMEEIAFLGGVADDEYQDLNDTITNIGIDLPVSTLEVAEGALQSVKTGFQAFEAEALAPTISKLQFFSGGAMDARESMEFLNAIIKQTEYTAEDGEEILDKLTRTMQMTAFSMDEIWRSWKSSRSAFSALGGDLDSFLTLLGVSRTALNPRFAGRAVSTWSSAFLKAFQRSQDPGSEKGDLFKRLMGDMEMEDLAGKPVETLTQIVNRSRELWSEFDEGGEETSASQQKRFAQLSDIFGKEATTMLQQFENYMNEARRGTSKSAEEIAKEIQNSSGYAEKYMERIKNTAWGMNEILTGTFETFRQKLGTAFEPTAVRTMQILQKLLEVSINIVEENEQLIRVLGTGAGLVGILTVLAGSVFMVTGALMSMYGSIMDVTLQMGTMGITSAEVLKNQLGSGAITVGNLIKANLLPPLKALISTMAVLAAKGFVMYLAWKYDFLRIRSVVTGTFKNIRESIQEANELMEKGPVEYTDRISELARSEDIWDRLTAKISKAMLFMEGLGTAVSQYQETGQWRITTETMAKLLGRSEEAVRSMQEVSPDQFTGMLNTFTEILKVIIRIGSFMSGFIEGTRDVAPLMKKILTPLKWIFRLFSRMIDMVSGTVIGRMLGLEPMRDSSYEGWEKIGYQLGRIVGILAALKITLSSVSLLVNKTIALFSKLLPLIGGGGGSGGAAGGGASASGSSSGGLLARLASMLRGGSSGGGTPTRLYEISDDLAGGAQNAHQFTSTTYSEPGGLLSTFKNRLFGQKVYGSEGSKMAGQYLGRKGGLLGGPLSHIDDMIAGTRLEGMLGKIASNLDILVSFVIWVYDILKAAKGEKLDTAIQTGGELTGGLAAAKLAGLFLTGTGIGTIPGLIITAIAYLIGSFSGGFIADKLKDPIKKLVSNIGDLLAHYLGSLASVPIMVTIAAKKLRERIINTLSDWWNRVWNGLTNKFSEFASRLVSLPLLSLQAMQNARQNALDKISNWWSNFWRNAVDKIVPDWIQNLKGEDKLSNQAPEDGMEKQGNEVDVVSRAAERSKKTGQKELNNIKDINANSSSNTRLQIGENAININVSDPSNPEEAAAGAQQIMDALYRKMEEDDYKHHRTVKAHYGGR